MSKVYVTQENHRLDYTDAERFGEVIFITNFEYSPSVNSKRNVQIQSDIRSILADFNPDVDFFLLSGDPIIMVLAFHFIAARVQAYTDVDKIRMLKWDGQDRRYNQILLTF